MTDIASLTQAINERLSNATGTRVRREELKVIFEEIVTYLDSLDAIGLAPELVSLIGLANAADKGLYFSAEDVFSLYDLTAYGRGLAGVADEAAFKALVNLEAGVDYQAYNANLAAYVAAVDGLTLPPPTRQLDVTVSSAEILALNATPKTLVAAPGVGKILQFIGALAVLDYNSIAYDGIAAGEDLGIRYINGTGNFLASFEATGFLDQASDQIRIAPQYSPLANNLTAANENQPLVLHMSGGEIATGNSPVKIRIWYRVIDYAALVA